MLFHIAVLVLVVSTTNAQTDAVHCLSCKGVTRPSDCLHETICNPGEICATTKYIKGNGQLVYDLKCMQTSTCKKNQYMVTTEEIQKRFNISSAPVIGKKRQDKVEVDVCIECCETKNCNRFLCDSIVDRLECLSCKNLESMSECDHLDICAEHEVCYVQESITDQFTLRFEGGCLPELQCDKFYEAVENNGVSIYRTCFTCCKESYCNYICKSDLPSTTTSRAVTMTSTAAAQSSTAFATSIPLTPVTADTASTAASTATTSIPSPSVTSHAATNVGSTAITTHCPTLPSLTVIPHPNITFNILSSAGCGQKNDITFIVDSSQWINEFEEHEFVYFAQSIASSLDIGINKTRLRYLHFNKQAHMDLRFDQGSDPDKIQQHLMSLINHRDVPQNNASLSAGIKKALSQPGRQNAKQYYVILTQDRIDDIDEAVKQANNARKQSIEVFMFGIGEFKDKVKDIVSSPWQDHFVTVDYVEDLAKPLEDILLGLCEANQHKPEKHCWDPYFYNTHGCAVKEDITLIIEHSYNTGDLKPTKLFIDEFVEKFNITPSQSRLGMMSYNDTLTVHFNLSDFSKKTDLTRNVNAAYLSLDNKSMHSFANLALEKTLDWYNHSAPDTIKVAVIFTNGASDRKFATLAAATELHRQGVVVFVVTNGKDGDQKEKLILASDPDVEHMLNVDDVDSLLAYLKNLATIQCKASMTTTTPPPPTTTMCPTLPSLAPITPPPTQTDMLSKAGCGGKDDIMFLVDSSVFISDYEEREFELFAKAFATSLDIGQDKTRFGYTYFNSDIHEAISLSSGADPLYVSNTLASLAHKRGLTVNEADLGSALQDILHVLQNDSRPDAKKHLVIFVQDNITNIAQAAQEAATAKSLGFDVYVIGIGHFDKVYLQPVKKMVSLHKHFLTVAYVEKLSGVLEDVLLEHCKDNRPPFERPCWKPEFLSSLGCGAMEDITLVLDQSIHNDTNEWDQIKLFIDKLVKSFDVSPNASRIGLMSYNNSVTELVPFHAIDDKNALMLDLDSKLAGVSQSRFSFTNEALDRTREWYKNSRPDAVKVAIIFTNGGPIRKSETLASAIELHRDNVTVFVVGVGNTVDLKQQMIIATDPGVEHVLNVDNVDGLMKYLEYLAVDRCKGTTSH